MNAEQGDERIKANRLQLSVVDVSRCLDRYRQQAVGAGANKDSDADKDAADLHKAKSVSRWQH